jgi:ATPase family AAA domain-containing protein 2
MPAGKRKIEFFDPNKSDSDDVDYVSGQDRPRKSSKRSRTQSKRSSGTKRRRTKYRGSDVSDDEVSDSLLEDTFSEEEEEEEEAEMDPTTGRRKRQAKAKISNYAESSDDGDLEEIEDEPEKESEEEAPPAKRAKLSKIVKLKVTMPGTTARSTRAGSAARGRRRTSTEPTSAGVTRRNTRAHTEEGEDLVALTTSGRHVEVVRSSRSPESVARARPTRGSKGLKKPASMIKEEEHESSSYGQSGVGGDATMDSDMIEVAQEEHEVIDVPSKENTDSHQEPSYDELAGEPAEPPPAAELEDDEDDEDDDEDAVPITRGGRTRASRASISAAVQEAAEEETATVQGERRTSRRLTRNSAARKGGQEQSSDFEPIEESGEEDPSVSEGSPKKGKVSDDTDGSPRRGRSAAQRKSKSSRSSRRRATDASDDEDEIDQEELIEEVQELKAGRRGNRQRQMRDSDILYERDRRTRKPVDYTIKPMDQIYAADEDADDVAATPSRGPRGRRTGGNQAWERNLYTTYGPFGGAGGPPALIGGPWGTGAAGGVDSDSSDDENMQRPNIGGNVGMTPTSAMPPSLLPGIGQTHNADAIAALGTPANFGKVKSQKALADADPLGVDQNVDFSKVGGLAGHIDQLKEMVQMPLLYPELFMKFHVTPPRGVLFHGPPGTGKTLLARALAASVGSGGRKITFYMRKGADALSKWVGEAERQLRLLFEEARKTQPSIIFFDEIDGLAPVRSSKQEQIHASIVSTLLALMDGMDGRGQVIVIGATNRPDNIDPALRRPGRFDREFYFPLPDFDGRLSVINIHTTDWGIDEAFKNSLAHATKGYAGADLRALCTEAALNAIQRTYPQIYSSNEKLIVNPDKIKITAKDFMLSIKKMIPSSERATSSGAAPLPKVVEPLLREQLKLIEKVLDGLIPIKKKVTALQEAMYEQYDDADQGFGRETLQQEFEKSRVFRPRLLIEGKPGMGQSYIGAALLNHFEGLHVQNFDLPTIYADSTRVIIIRSLFGIHLLILAQSAETAIVQLFAEVKRHKPSVIYIPGIDTWYHTLSGSTMTTFLGLLRSIPPTDPILVLGIADTEPEHVDRDMLRDIFGFSKKNRFEIVRPSRVSSSICFEGLL